MLGWNIILCVIQIADVVILDINVLITVCNLERITTTFVMILVSVLLEIAMICITIKKIPLERY